MHSAFPDVIVWENKPPPNYTKTQHNNYKNNTTGTVCKFPKLGAFEVSFNNTILFSKSKTTSWPAPGQVVELVANEIKRVENCIPNDDDLNRSFVRNRAMKNQDEFSRPQSS